jgi:hypothetical protein
LKVGVHVVVGVAAGAAGVGEVAVLFVVWAEPVFA